MSDSNLCKTLHPFYQTYVTIPTRKEKCSMAEHQSRCKARAKPDRLRVINLKVCQSDVEALLYEKLKEIYLNSVTFETFEIREAFLRRLLSLTNVTTFCVQNRTKFVLPRISKGLLKGCFPHLTNLLLEYIALEQRTMELIAVALTHRRPLGFLELYKPKIDNPNYASIFSLIPKICKFVLVNSHPLSQRDMFLLVKALNTPAEELQDITVRQYGRFSLKGSQLNQKQLAAAIERKGQIKWINGYARPRFVDLWPSMPN